MSMSVKVLAPAKINLSLDILRRRPDGYHDVSMVMQTVSLYDTVTVSLNESREITVSCNWEGVPCDEKNIVCKAAEAFFRYTHQENPGVHIDIDKKIPTQAGLAGGSTDGAAVLIALNKLLSGYLKPGEMAEIAEKLGADVPFCLSGGTQQASGTGTNLRKITAFPNCHLVICKPPVSVSTAEAYQKCDLAEFTHPEYTAEMIKALYRRDMYTITSCLYNDFEVALALEEVREVKKIMYQCKAKGACMTGSGSAVFAVFTSLRKAEKCAETLKKQYEHVFLCAPVKEGCKIVD